VNFQIRKKFAHDSAIYKNIYNTYNTATMTSELFQSKLLDIQRNMLNFAYTLTSNRDDAYDLLQDTTLKVLDNEDK